MHLLPGFWAQLLYGSMASGQGALRGCATFDEGLGVVASQQTPGAMDPLALQAQITALLINLATIFLVSVIFWPSSRSPPPSPRFTTLRQRWPGLLSCSLRLEPTPASFPRRLRLLGECQVSWLNVSAMGVRAGVYSSSQVLHSTCRRMQVSLCLGFRRCPCQSIQCF